MPITKFNCETYHDSDQSYGIMEANEDGSYVSTDDYDELKNATLELLHALHFGARNSTNEVNARKKLIELLDLVNNV